MLQYACGITFETKIFIYIKAYTRYYTIIGLNLYEIDLTYSIILISPSFTRPYCLKTNAECSSSALSPPTAFERQRNLTRVGHFQKHSNEGHLGFFYPQKEIVITCELLRVFQPIFFSTYLSSTPFISYESTLHLSLYLKIPAWFIRFKFSAAILAAILENMQLLLFFLHIQTLLSYESTLYIFIANVHTANV